MEMPSKATALNLFAICFALGLLIVVLVDFMRPQLSRLGPVSGDPSVLDANWFSERAFKLLGGESPPTGGIDTGGIAERNPFKRLPRVAEPVEPEPPQVEPEPEPDPPPPATRDISLVYRGLYRSSSGEPFVYLEVENVTRVYSTGETVAPGWTIAEANANELILDQGEAGRERFPFNQKKSLEVPIE